MIYEYPCFGMEKYFDRLPLDNFLDPIPDVVGMASPMKLLLLNSLFYYCVGYLEIGTYQGKSLIGAAEGNYAKPTVCIDNFSEFDGTLQKLNDNINKYKQKWSNSGKKELTNVNILQGDFRKMLARVTIKVDLYFYDGAHDYQSQFDGIQLVEPILSDNAVVVVDDWRFADDSQSYAEQATLDAIAVSKRKWRPIMVLPARYNGDMEWGWNGVGVFHTWT